MAVIFGVKRQTNLKVTKQSLQKHLFCGVFFCAILKGKWIVRLDRKNKVSLESFLASKRRTLKLDLRRVRII